MVTSYAKHSRKQKRKRKHRLRKMINAMMYIITGNLFPDDFHLFII